MLKIQILFFVCIFNFSLSFAQNVSITYFSKVNPYEKISSSHLEMNYTLLVKNNESVCYSHVGDEKTEHLYKKNYVDKPQEDIKVQVSEHRTVYLAKKKYEVFYKNYQKDSIIYKDKIMSENNKVFIGEKISTLFNWKIIPKSDSIILGYKCQKATAEFRGRKYVAYFNSQIAQMGGPWKFDGLPGMILYVHSEDNYFVIEPQKIEINKDTQKIDNYYEKEKIISWETFKKSFRERMERMIKRMKSRNLDGGSISISERIEDLGIKEIGFKK